MAHAPHRDKLHKRQRNFLRWITMITMTIPDQREKPQEREVFFDTDSGPVGIDNRCSVCSSHRTDDFHGPLHDTKRAIRGFGGTRTASIKVGTIIWKWADDNGKVHSIGHRSRGTSTPQRELGQRPTRNKSPCIGNSANIA